MPIIASATKLVRQTIAPWVYFADGEVKTEQIRVHYRGKSVKEAREIAEKLWAAYETAKAAAEKEQAEKADSKKSKKTEIEVQGETISLDDEQIQAYNPKNSKTWAELVFEKVVGLPDLINAETQKPQEITLEWLLEQDVQNLRAIMEAIGEHESPKQPTAK
jgi:hypothetical protein